MVVTGGEPLLQQAELVVLLERLKAEAGSFVEVETACTLKPSPRLTGLVDWWDASPKLSSSGNPEKLRERPDVIAFFAALPNATFKLVVGSLADVEEAAGWVERNRAPRERVLLMPQATTREQLAEVTAWLLPECARRGLRYSPRLHVLAWGARRGV